MTSVPIIYSVGCSCTTCSAHSLKTSNCQCGICLTHKGVKNESINTINTDPLYLPPNNDVVFVDDGKNKRDKNGWMVFWIIIISVIVIIFFIGLMSYNSYGTRTTTYTSDSYYKCNTNETVKQVTTTPDGNKIYYVYRNTNENGYWGWTIFWIFLFLIIFSPTYYYVK